MPVLSGTDPRAVRTAAERLAGGDLVAFPTETVYGLGARADDDAAVHRIFEAKGRPADHPLIVHVASRRAAERFADWPDAAQRLADAFWPGPLTLILPRRPGLGDAASGGQASIGLRMPDHAVARALLAEAEALGVAGVAGPSANRFGRVSPTRAAHVLAEFGDALCVLDGGPCAVGIESAIVDCSRADGAAALLRPGTLGRAAIEAVLGAALAAPDVASPRAPGTLASHYAPRARVRLFDAADLAARLAAGPPPGVAVYGRAAAGDPRVAPGLRQAMPEDPAGAARELFAVLRGFDDAGAVEVWVERPPPGADWDGVRDRLARAAA